MTAGAAAGGADNAAVWDGACRGPYEEPLERVGGT
jgi:hypothetical protein